MSLPEPRFGIWAPVGGPFVVDYTVEKLGASYAESRDLVLLAERLGFDTVLFAQHTIRPVNQELEQLEAWTAAAAVAAITERIEVIAAIKPKLYHPVVLAKLALGIEDISGGRFAINFVNAWFKPELEKSGIGFGEHDDRYVYGGEWLEIVKRLIAGEEVTHHGKNFHVDSYKLRPKSRFRTRPRIYSGGESEPARKLAADLADVWFINGQPLEEVLHHIADLSQRPRRGEPIAFGLSVFVIARETDEEARQVFEEFRTIQGKFDRTEFFKNVDEKAVMFHTAKKFPHVGTNGGTAAGLVGDYDTVARRIREFQEIGITTFMIQFHPMAKEMERFAQEIIPRIRALRRELVAA